MKQTYLEGGKICGAHGVRGGLKAESLCDSPQILASQKRVFFRLPDGSFSERKVLHGSVAGRFVLLELEGVSDRDAAFALKDTVIFLHRDGIPLPDGAAFIADLIGMPVTDADSGRVYGTLREVTDVPQGQMYTVATEAGDVLFPGFAPFLIRADADAGVFIRPIPGFFSDDTTPAPDGKEAQK